MKSFLLQILKYNHYYNQELLTRFIEHTDKLPERSVQVYNHLLNAQQIWNNRIQPEEPSNGVWEVQALQFLKELDDRNYEKSVRIINEFSLDTIIHYTNTKGQESSNTVSDIVFHIVNHGTYHRGQIAVAFREAGIEPMLTDYILYKRQNLSV